MSLAQRSKRFLPLVLFVLFAFALPFAAAPASAATTIDVPNGSFELPTVPNESPWAKSDIDNWQKAPMPSWWPGTGMTEAMWDQTTGVFLGVPEAPIDNIDGNQAAFLFATPGVELYQDLAATYGVGQAYHLTVGLVGGGYGMPVGTPIDLRLYYRNDAGDRIVVGSATATNTNDGGPLSHFTDWTLDIPTVTAGDAWAGRNIGVQIISPAATGGYWDLDNVRLTATPEPATLALLALGGAALSSRRRRR